jgi:hypothetical protein
VRSGAVGENVVAGGGSVWWLGMVVVGEMVDVQLGEK